MADAAAEYVAYIGRLPAHIAVNEAAAEIILDELKQGGVEASTSDTVSADITTVEAERVCSNLPSGKSPGPGRIPNEFY